MVREWFRSGSGIAEQARGEEGKGGRLKGGGKGRRIYRDEAFKLVVRAGRGQQHKAI